MFSQANMHRKQDEHQKVGRPSESKMSKARGMRNKFEVFVNDKPSPQIVQKENKWEMRRITHQIINPKDIIRNI